MIHICQNKNVILEQSPYEPLKWACTNCRWWKWAT